MELIIEGVVRRVNQPQEFASGFRKCEVHVEVPDGEYKDIFPVEFIKDMADEAGTLTPGMKVKMRCNVRGREWDGGEKGWRAFMSLTVWKYEILTETEEMKAQAAAIEKVANDDGFPF
jgi:hypothetical protein